MLVNIKVTGGWNIESGQIDPKATQGLSKHTGPETFSFSLLYSCKCPSEPSPVDVDVSGLADSVAAVLRLSVHGGVPVAVVEHHRVGARQVHPDAAAASRQNEAEDTAICVEALHERLEETEGDAQTTSTRVKNTILFSPRGRSLFLKPPAH